MSQVKSISPSPLKLVERSPSLQEFTLLYEKYAPAVYGVINQLLPAVAADQMLHTVFVSFWNNLQSGDKSDRVLVKLLQLTHQFCRQHHQ